MPCWVPMETLELPKLHEHCFLTFYFVLGQSINVVIVSGEQQRDSAKHILVSILPKLPSHPSCHLTLSRVPWVAWVFFSSVADLNCSAWQLLSRVRLFAAPWTAAHQASLSITNSRSLLKLMSIELVMPSNHLILCRPLLKPSFCLCCPWGCYCLYFVTSGW